MTASFSSSPMSRFARLRSALPRRSILASTAAAVSVSAYLLAQNEREDVSLPSDPASLYYGARSLRLDAPRPVGSDSDRPSPTWTPPNREEMLRELRKGGKPGEEFDLLVVGGGATGAGIAVDAASRGLKVGLVERDDFSSGA